MFGRKPTPTQVRLAQNLRLVNAYCDLLDAYMGYANAQLDLIKVQQEIVEYELARLNFGKDSDVVG